MKNLDEPVLNESFNAFHHLCRHTTTIAFLFLKRQSLGVALLAAKCVSYMICIALHANPWPALCSREALRPRERIVKS